MHYCFFIYLKPETVLNYLKKDILPAFCEFLIKQSSKQKSKDNMSFS